MSDPFRLTDKRAQSGVTFVIINGLHPREAARS